MVHMPHDLKWVNVIIFVVCDNVGKLGPHFCGQLTFYVRVVSDQSVEDFSDPSFVAQLVVELVRNQDHVC